MVQLQYNIICMTQHYHYDFEKLYKPRAHIYTNSITVLALSVKCFYQVVHTYTFNMSFWMFVVSVFSLITSFTNFSAFSVFLFIYWIFFSAAVTIKPSLTLLMPLTVMSRAHHVYRWEHQQMSLSLCSFIRSCRMYHSAWPLDDESLWLHDLCSAALHIIT